jgi:sterol-4alpha-carboxylate 3-dehydrogenase (decarboxylating)
VFPQDLKAKLDKLIHSKKSHLNIRYFVANILDKEKLKELFEDKKVNVVVHAASLIAIWQDPKKHMLVNVEGTKNVLEACTENNVERCILISSLDVVVNENGIQNVEGSEDLPYATNPLYSGYAASKIQQEKLVLNSYEPKKFFTTSLRPLGIYGPRDIYHIGSVLSAAKDGKLIVWPKHEPAFWQHVYSGNVAYVRSNSIFEKEIKYSNVV